MARFFARRFTAADRLHLRLRGTPFQLKIWESLLRVPEGGLRTYAQLAEAAERGTAVRAAGTAIGANPVGDLIPCHRMIRQTGELDPYRWGAARKAALLGWEAARAGAVPVLARVPLAKGRHKLVVVASDYQETKNMENVPPILPNTATLRTTLVVR